MQNRTRTLSAVAVISILFVGGLYRAARSAGRPRGSTRCCRCCVPWLERRSRESGRCGANTVPLRKRRSRYAGGTPLGDGIYTGTEAIGAWIKG